MHYSVTNDASNLAVNNHVLAAKTMADVGKDLSSRGIVMDISHISNPIPFSLSQLAASNEELKEVQAKLATGELSADAPSSEMYSEWTEEEKNRVKSALGEMFGWH